MKAISCAIFVFCLSLLATAGAAAAAGLQVLRRPSAYTGWCLYVLALAFAGPDEERIFVASNFSTGITSRSRHRQGDEK